MDNNTNDIKRKLVMDLRRLTWATIIVYLVVIAAVVWFRVDSNNQRDALAAVARDNKHALCALRADQERQVEVSEQFLEQNPEGIPGISAATIRQGIESRLRTINALADLNCPSDKP